MRQSVVIILALVAFAQVSQAQESSTRSLDAKAISEALTDFLTELRTQIRSDVSTWRDRAQKVRTDFKDRFNAGSDEASRRRSLLTDSLGDKLDAKLDLLGRGWELIMDASGAVKEIIEAKSVKVKDFFGDILGADYAQYLPHNWLSDAFGWDALGDFDLHSNMAEFLDTTSIPDFTRPANLPEMMENVETMKNHFCKEEEPIPHYKVPTTCEGPKITLLLQPKTCIVKSEDKQIVCDPAKLVLVKTPGFCVLKHYKATTWKGKECRISAEIGFTKTATLGARHFNVTLNNVDMDPMGMMDHFSGLFHHDESNTRR